MSVARTKRPKRAHLIKAGRVAAKALELLEKVNDLIRDKDGWTRAAFARDGDGKSTEPGEPEACSFCLVGALSHVYETEHAAALAGGALWTRGWPPPTWSVRGSRALGRWWTA